MASNINKLPSVLQTKVEKNFISATLDQATSKKDSALLQGFIGERTPGNFDPINDFYIPEVNKDRTWWQLEATAFSRDTDQSKTNILFYPELIERIKYYGGDVSNHDRLFNSEYYSWAPPIDFDMFINYQNYYWVDARIPAFTITGVL